MKNLLFILTLFLGIILMASTSETGRDVIGMDNIQNKESVLNNDSSKDIHHQLQVLSSFLQNSKGIPSQFNSQRASQSINWRVLKDEERTHQFFFTKDRNSLCKIIHTLTVRQTTNLSSLLCLRGYNIFGLRKIII